MRRFTLLLALCFLLSFASSSFAWIYLTPTQYGNLSGGSAPYGNHLVYTYQVGGDEDGYYQVSEAPGNGDNITLIFKPDADNMVPTGIEMDDWFAAWSDVSCVISGGLSSYTTVDSAAMFPGYDSATFLFEDGWQYIAPALSTQHITVTGNSGGFVAVTPSFGPIYTPFTLTVTPNAGYVVSSVVYDQPGAPGDVPWSVPLDAGYFAKAAGFIVSGRIGAYNMTYTVTFAPASPVTLLTPAQQAATFTQFSGNRVMVNRSDSSLFASVLSSERSLYSVASLAVGGVSSALLFGSLSGIKL